MRVRSAAALGCLLMALQGCNLTIPSGLLQSVQKGGGIPVSDSSDCRAMFFQFDVNGDGALSQDEYVRGRLSQLSASSDARLKADLQAAFKRLDQNGDGKVTLEEFLFACNGTTGPTGTASGTSGIATGTPAPAACDVDFASFDKNKDGYWDFGEFQSWYATQPHPVANCELDAQPSDAPPTTGPGMGIMQLAEPLPTGKVSILPTIRRKPVCAPALDLKALFLGADRNGDGRLSPDEVCAFLDASKPLPLPSPIVKPSLVPLPIEPTPWPFPSSTPLPNPTLTPGCVAWFPTADTNHDGRLDISEWMASGGGAGTGATYVDQLKTMFSQLDLNHDGYLSPQEACAAPLGVPTATPGPVAGDCATWFYGADANGDNQVDWSEFVASEGLDANNLTAEQKQDLSEVFNAMDLNHDGVLTQDESCLTDLVPSPMPVGTPLPFVTPTPFETATPPETPNPFVTPTPTPPPATPTPTPFAANM